MMKRLCIFFVVVCLALPFFAQEDASADTTQQTETRQKKKPDLLPKGYGGITLGMSVDEVKDALKKNHEFGYRGDRDVSLSPSDGQTLIETDATYAPFSYFERCWFQFSDDKLYIITINLNQEKIDHYSIFSKLCAKYGGPNQLSPRKSQWNDDDVMMSLERPLALKYIDAKVFNEKQDAAGVEKTIGEQNRDAFLEGL